LPQIHGTLAAHLESGDVETYDNKPFVRPPYTVVSGLRFCRDFFLLLLLLFSSPTLQAL